MATSLNEVATLEEKRRTFILEIETKSNTDEDDHQWVNGLAMLPNNNLVVIERYNRKLKLIDTARHQLISEIKLPSPPVDVAKTSADTVAVVLPDKREIVFVRIVPSLAIIGGFKVTGECSGVSYNEERGWLALTFSTPRVELVDLTGQAIRVIASSDTQHLFTRAERVVFSHDNKTLFVSSGYPPIYDDPDRKVVLKINLDGKLLASCINRRIFSADGMVACRNGGVYIADHRAVFFISADCNNSNELLNRNERDTWRLEYPSCLQMSEDEDMLYVGAYGRSTISVFK